MPRGMSVVIDVSAVVASVRYKPGWSFKVGGPGNTMLCIFAPTPDSWHPESERTTQHQFAIPAAAVGRCGFADLHNDERDGNCDLCGKPWRWGAGDVVVPFDVVRWILDCLLLAERHECCEFFEVGGRRPFYPHHQGLGSPYVIVDRRVSDV